MLRRRIREITEIRVHYGYRRVHVLLRREGWKDNHKRVYRLYREQGLSLRHRRPRRNKAARCVVPLDACTPLGEPSPGVDNRILLHCMTAEL